MCSDCRKKYRTKESKDKKRREMLKNGINIEKEKQCTQCKKVKLFGDFHKSNTRKIGYKSICKICASENGRKYRENNYEKVKKIVRRSMRKWREANPEKSKQSSAKFFRTNPNYRREYEKNRSKNDLNFKIKKNLRSRLRSAILKNQKSGSAIRDLGCSIEELKTYLEQRFYPHSKTRKRMTWRNYGKNGWHIDHVKPLVSFDLTKREQFLEACHYTNLQPLWAKDNLRKGAR
jgi:hypothetical protein